MGNCSNPASFEAVRLPPNSNVEALTPSGSIFFPMRILPEEIRRELSQGEQPVWWGRPRQGLVLRGSDALAIPFSLLWCGFAFFWEFSVVSSHAPILFRLWGVPFVAVGLHAVIGRFFWDAKQRATTYYAVTPERILIVSGVFKRNVKSLNISTLSDLSLSQSSSGEGSILFGPQHARASVAGGFQGWPGSQGQMGPQFDLIGDAKSVYETIRKVQRTTRPGA